ncbi:MAG: NUDIX hydrolase, partial [Thermoplasmatota archaeon]
CPSGHVDYQNPAPTAGVAIRRGDSVLLAKRAGPPKQGLWDLPGGFLEPGEVVTDGLRREIREETGLELTALRRLHQAPGDYAGKPTLNFIYTANADGEPIAGDDVAELQWFLLHALPPLAWPHEADALQKLQGA